jgi:hypothetical protein
MGTHRGLLLIILMATLFLHSTLLSGLSSSEFLEDIDSRLTYSGNWIRENDSDVTYRDNEVYTRTLTPM